MLRIWITVFALCLSACAPYQSAPDTSPPPGFPPGPEMSQTDRICSGMVAGGLQRCAPSEFCYIPEGQYCGAADYPGMCRPKPEMCTMDYNPVCGCDGRTYSNACAAHSQGVSVATKGECR